MSRLLFVGPPFVGHLNPAISVATELEARGHEVGWVGDEALLKKLGSKATVVRGVAFDRIATLATDRPSRLRGNGAIALLWNGYLDVARSTYALIAEALEVFEPCLVLCDQQMFAGGLAAHEAGYRWLTLATTSAEIVSCPEEHSGFHRWMANALAELESGFGLADSVDPRLSPFGILLFSSCALTGPLPGHLPILSAGCSTKYREESAVFPWEKLDKRRKLLVSLGTLNGLAGKTFLDEAWQACWQRRETMQTILLDPTASIRYAPNDDVLILKSVPQLALLKQLDAVLCHGGQNTISEAISHGVPLVVAPIRDDQPMNAAQVVDAGIGVRVRFGHPSAPAIGAAIDAVLTNPAYRAAAMAIAPSMINGTDRAADAIERFLRTGTLADGMDSHGS
jgi:UDP:flavonoid glycosyltransferase YjiC (YdhE family)